MSDMSLDVAVRALQKNKSVSDIYQKISADERFTIDESDTYRRFDKEETVYQFIFESKDLESRMRVIEIDKEVFFDFLLSEDSDGYSVDETFTPSQFEYYKEILEDINLDSDDLRLRVLYYYNGGCAGVTEIV